MHSTRPATNRPGAAGDRRDAEELFRSHHERLGRLLQARLGVSRELAEDACGLAWLQLLRLQPDADRIVGWLYTVAIHEAYRLSATERHDARLEHLTSDGGDWDVVIADGHSLDAALEAREALRALASLPARQRDDLALLIAGYSYREIAEITGGRTRTNVNKALVKARKRLRRGARSPTSTRAGRPTTAPSRSRLAP